MAWTLDLCIVQCVCDLSFVSIVVKAIESVRDCAVLRLSIESSRLLEIVNVLVPIVTFHNRATATSHGMVNTLPATTHHGIHISIRAHSARHGHHLQVHK